MLLGKKTHFITTEKLLTGMIPGMQMRKEYTSANTYQYLQIYNNFFMSLILQLFPW